MLVTQANLFVLLLLGTLILLAQTSQLLHATQFSQSESEAFESSRETERKEFSFNSFDDFLSATIGLSLIATTDFLATWQNIGNLYSLPHKTINLLAPQTAPRSPPLR